MIEWLVRVVVLALEVALALPLLYLLLLSAAALVAARRARSVSAAGSGQDAQSASAALPSIHFALLVPAHDEALVITELLESVAALDYPAERRDVYVIADNCTDDTADLVRKARTPNVQVCERRDDHQRGKGYALRWLLEELERAGHRCNAYVIVDADS